MNTAITPRRRQPSFFQWCVRYLFNFSLISIVGILVYILFFTDTSVQTTYEYERQIDHLTQEIKNENDSLEHYRQLNHRLASDLYTIEKEARENYHMQRPYEDVYIIK